MFKSYCEMLINVPRLILHVPTSPGTNYVCGEKSADGPVVTIMPHRYRVLQALGVPGLGMYIYKLIPNDGDADEGDKRQMCAWSVARIPSET